MKRTTFAMALISALLVSTITEARLVNWAGANPYPYTNCGSSFVTVSILSPENKTYDTNSILLTVFAGAYPGVWYVRYSIDSGPFTELAPGHLLGHTFNESVLLNGLAKGSHIIVVEAGAMAPSPVGKVTDSFQVHFAISTSTELQSEIMSFEEAVESAASASIGNFSQSTNSYDLRREPERDSFVDESGVRGFLMWLAPNRILYEAEYSSGRTLKSIGYVSGQPTWNPPEGCYIWHLSYGNGEEYWVLANNGTIFLYNPPRGSEPSPSIEPTPNSNLESLPTTLVIAAAASVVVTCTALLVYFKKRGRGRNS